MNELQVFNFESSDVRTVILGNEPWFVAKDVATVLEYNNPRDAIAKHVDDEDKGVMRLLTPGGPQVITVINESGIYSLIFSSKQERAKRFKHWVTKEILPALRKRPFANSLKRPYLDQRCSQPETEMIFDDGFKTKACFKKANGHSELLKFSIYSASCGFLLKNLEMGTRGSYGYVYILECGNGVKIGSTIYPYQRFIQLSKSLGEYGGLSIGRIAVSSACGNYRDIETWAHYWLEDVRKEGTELFEIGFAEAIAEIESCRVSLTEKKTSDDSFFEQFCKPFVLGQLNSKLVTAEEETE